MHFERACGVQVQCLQPLVLEATVTCSTHKRAVAVMDWRILPLPESDLLPETTASAMEPENINSTHRVLCTDGGSSRLMKMNAITRTRHRIASTGQKRPLDPGLDATGALGGVAGHAMHGGQGHATAGQNVSEVFVGAGPLETRLEVGKEGGVGRCQLQGMFLRAGKFEVSFVVLELFESPGGAKLPVNDYAISHPQTVLVGRPSTHDPVN